MSSGSIARRYAKALFSLAKESATLESTGTEVRELATAIKSSDELAETLSNPAFPKGDRKKVVGTILKRQGASEITTNFAMLLLDRDRLAVVPMISIEFDRMVDDEIGRVAAVVTSAEPLAPSQQARLVGVLEKLANRKIDLETKVDPELLGGVIAKVGDLVYDASLRTQLRQIRAELS